MNKNKFFIYAGFYKTGSTWLFEVLNKHPEVEMPVVKEINYFSLNKRLRFALFNKQFSKRLFSKQSYRRLRGEFFIKNIRIIGYRNWKERYKLLSYFFSNWNDEWYQSLFSSDKLSGDISPSYFTMPEEVIGRIKKINPNTKIIIGLRDPIDRQWSALKMQAKGFSKQKLDIKDKEFTEKIRNRNFRHQDYSMLMCKWGGVFT